jgi:hypothetical protein
MIILRPSNLHWIKDAVDDPEDLCAHSGVDFRVDDDVLVSSGDGDWTVSAVALYLLRTLSPTQFKDEGGHLAQKLFPCCGHPMYDTEGGDDVVVLGCPNGIDFTVIRDGDNTLITGANGRTHKIRFTEWRDAVCAFSDQVQSFYAASSPKRPCDDVETKGFKKFMAEWLRRRTLAPSLR